MKFEQQLEFNAVAEWREHYINYEQLKRLIYSIEQGEAMQSKARTSLDLQRQTEAETTPLQQPLLNARHSSLSVASSGDKAFDPETEFVRLVRNIDLLAPSSLLPSLLPSI